ncbi:MAG TPA: TetR family transcriptional regulator [Baekduia sp.]|nr:TetR family transcriptional regulator [Baekduia sp.]
MPGDAQATRQRLLDAASAEFAAFGIAGARVDRIAAAAKSNKAQIYHYFGSKDDLFDAVFDELVIATVHANPLDAADLPGYAAGLFDGYEARPEVARLATWYRLERSASRPPLALRIAASKDKIARIAAAQADGTISTTLAPADLLALVTTIAGMWTAMTPEDHAAGGRRSRAHRRQVVVDAVKAILAG